MIRWICLSDMHFGAENSLLSHVDPETASVDPDNPSPVLRALIACLREIVDLNGDVPKPILVLNGDILEFALAQDNIAAMVFDRFIDLAFDPAHPLFDPAILYLPGNHDHHLWETARERMYAHYVRDASADVDLEPPWHATNLFVDRSRTAPEAELLNALVRRRGGQHLSVRIVYPNLGLGAAGRHVIIHHGHFTEPLYRLISSAKGVVFPRQPVGPDVWDWEADNFAWIDFFWSTLGRSGSAGNDVGLVYDMLQSEKAMRQLSSEIGAFAGNRFRPPLRGVARWVGRRVAGDLAAYFNSRERQHPEIVLTDEGREGLISYLTGPLARQIQGEMSNAMPNQVAFVFGHTHKPFERGMDLSGYKRPVPVYNSGGWVVDTVTDQPTQGAAVLLIDDKCEVTSIRMYNQEQEATDYRVWLSSDTGAGPSETHRWIERRSDFTEPPWSDFSETAAREVALRHELLPRIINRGLVDSAG